MSKPSELSASEIDFLRANYKNHTAKELTLSLNKIRQRLREKILTVRYVNEFISRLTGGVKVINEASVKESLLQAPPLERGRPPTILPSDRKTKALKDYQSGIEEGGLCEPLESLFPPDCESEKESTKDFVQDASHDEDHEKDN